MSSFEAKGEVSASPAPWQPIETAPKVEWGERIEALVYSPRLGIKDAQIGNFRGHLFASVSCFTGNAVESWGVTHWMPLPAPPEIIP